jgi:hypothetical protein
MVDEEREVNTLDWCIPTLSSRGKVCPFRETIREGGIL